MDIFGGGLLGVVGVIYTAIAQENILKFIMTCIATYEMVYGCTCTFGVCRESGVDCFIDC